MHLPYISVIHMFLKHLSACVFQQGTSLDAELLAGTCDEVIRHCLQLGSEDNMTAMLVSLTESTDRKIDFNE